MSKTREENAVCTVNVEMHDSDKLWRERKYILPQLVWHDIKVTPELKGVGVIFIAGMIPREVYVEIRSTSCVELHSPPPLSIKGRLDRADG